MVLGTTKSSARGWPVLAGEAELLLYVHHRKRLASAQYTLIVDRADRFGLSDLYQLRGRVGRSDRRAYAYFLYPADGTMTPAGRHRLEKVAEHTSLGSGFALAMEDLELRGAGEILGARQSGLFAQVGYDLYVRLLREAIEEVRGLGEAWKEPAVCEISWNAYLPEEWIGSKDLAPRLYREIAGARSLADLAEARGALADRFGPLPAPVENLFFQAEIACSPASTAPSASFRSKTASRSSGSARSPGGDGCRRAAVSPLARGQNTQDRLRRGVKPRDLRYLAGVVRR